MTLHGGVPKLASRSSLAQGSRSPLSSVPAPAAAPRPLPRWAEPLAAVLVATSFFLIRSRLLLGDAAVYAHQIETNDFHDRALHLLYYLVGWVVVHLTRPLGIPPDTALIGFSSVMMATAVWLSLHLFRVLGADERTARWGVFVLLFAGVVIQQGTEAEVYAWQLSLSVASYIAYLRDRPAWAGVLLGLATLTTPLGVLIVGFFLAEAIRSRRWKPFIVLGVVGSVVFLSALALVWRDYFYGTRGLLVDQRIAQTSANGLDNLVALVKNFHFMLPFLAAGLVIAWRRERAWIWLLVGLTIFHLLAALTVTENGVFLLPMYPLLALLIGLGVVAGLRGPGTWRTVTSLLLALYAGTSLLIWLQPYDQRVRDGMLAGFRQVPPGSTIVTSWSFAMTLGYYAGPPRDTLAASRTLLWPEKRAGIELALRSGGPVYLMEPHRPTRGVQWLYPRAMQERHYDQYALMPRLRRSLGIRATPFFSTRGGPIVYRIARP